MDQRRALRRKRYSNAQPAADGLFGRTLPGRMVQAGVHTLIVSRKEGFLAKMLDHHSHFRMLFQDQRERFRAYQRGKQPIRVIENFPLHVGRWTPDFMHFLKENHPSEYQQTVRGFLVECLGLSEKSLDDILSRRCPAFQVRNFD